ncbi:succinate-semialdehyde dehydrogenase/glutarate-semialdehyde dehydrogenase [Mycobacterium frederiksbergense]|uniref:Succinate-semialdehyde dehydrogenase/glutarate-semialdehyde dehydrogenase n=1 Tax=Mycolicibacterium frederiksbergense TaxID=117567 RepID=A0ABT6L6J0_9MYCO|nr:NAD-dependent succinate-semialdehyde dehydrogenase [Mycolicibacterium frederiksbergense]MDH6198569.1 succinate-semialdehyde dehydrogenase/glutarate-semialdehyde dehydrogenase [Mycolicibacterium frederiksbergense]
MQTDSLRLTEVDRAWQAYVDGRWVDAADGATSPVENPATGAVIAQVPAMTEHDVSDAITAARRAYRGWRRRPAQERCRILRAWYEAVLAHGEELAALLTREQGKPLREARAEIAQAASYLEWFAEEGRRAYGDTIPANTADRRLLVLREPVGVVGVITPWNFPAAMITRKVAAALAAGCTVVVKPAEETPLTALALAEIGARAGVPDGVVNVITGSGPRLGKVLTASPHVRKISFTGSTEVGKILARDSAATLKRMSLELGGNAPLIVFDDADLDLAVRGAVASKFRNCGQTCVATNRIYVARTVADEFLRRFAAAVAELRVGPGDDGSTDLGPLINRDALAAMELAVKEAEADGARVVLGGRATGGLFFEPTILGDVADTAAITRAEIFGPIAPVSVFDTVDEVIERANNTAYGLAAYFYTRDYARVIQVSEALEYGMVGVNESLVATEVAPFGGVKESGYGREGSYLGLDDYLSVKYVCLGGLGDQS